MGSGKIYLLIYASILLVFLALFAPIYMQKEQLRQQYLDLPSTDFSSLDIAGIKLGDRVSGLEPGIEKILFENGEGLPSYSDARSISPSYVQYIMGNFSLEALGIIHYKGKTLASYEQCMTAFGANYILETEAIRSNREQALVYLDHEHNIQVSLLTTWMGLTYIEMESIEARISQMSMFTADTWFGLYLCAPTLIPSLFAEMIQNREMISIGDIILIPLFAALLLLPIVNLIRYRNRQWAILSALVIVYLLLGHSILLPGLMSV